MPAAVPARKTGPAPIPAEVRFWRFVDRTEPGCWNWKGRTNDAGYGRLSAGSRTIAAHRLAYELLIGPIPPGLVIDHLCRNRRCVNPAHLRVCTQRENILAPGAESPAATGWLATHCLRGHPYDLFNTLINSQGARCCRMCARERWHRRHQRSAA